MKSHCSVSLRALCAAASLLAVATSPAAAATITKSATGTDLNAGASWGGTAPGSADIGTWSTGSLGGSLTLGTDVNWQGISILDASADIGITGIGQFTLGTSGIVIDSNAKDLSIGSRVNTGSSSQSWTVGAGRKLTVSGVNVGAATLSINGPGTIDVQGVFLTGGSNVFTTNGVVNQSDGTLNLLDTTDVIRLGHWTWSTGNQYNLSGGTLNVLSTTLYNGWDSASEFNISGGTANLKGLALGGLTSNSSLTLSGGRLNIGSSGISYRNYGGGRAINLGAGTVGAMANWSTGTSLTLTGTGANAVVFNTLDSADGTTARTITLNGVLSGAGGLVKNGAGTLRLTAQNTFSGGLTVNAGKVEIAASPTWNVSTMGAGSITINSGATVEVQNVHLLGWNVGTNNNIIINGGTLAFGSNDNYIGNLTLTDNASVTGSAYFALAGGNLSYTGSESSKQATIGTRVSLGNISGAVNATFTVNGSNSSGDLVFSNYVYGGGKVTKEGTGTVVFSANNQYSGGTALNAGTIRLNYAENAGTSGPLGTATAVGSITFGGGALQYSAANQYDYSARFSTAAGQQYKVDTNSQNVTWGTALTSSGGTLTKSGNGTLTLSQANTYDGATVVNGGTLSVTGSIASSAVTVASGATLAGTGTVGNVTVAAGGILSAGVAGAGTLTVGDVAFSGAGTVSIGVLAGAINSTLQVGGNLATNGGNNSVTLALGTGLATLGTGTYTLLTYAGTQLSDVTAFTYSGTQGARQGVSVSNGTKAIELVVSSAYPIWTGASSDDFSAAIGDGTTNWKLSGGGAIAAAFVINDTVRFDSTASRGTVNLTADVAAASVAFEGDSLDYTLGSAGNYKITSGQLTKSGSHNLTINTANTYEGGTVLAGSGTVTLGNNGALGIAAVSLNGGTLALSGNTLANDITLGGGSISGAGTLSGVLSGSTLTKSGNGTLSLTGDNTFSGDLTVSGGILAIGGAGRLANGAYAGVLTLGSGAGLAYGSSASQTLSGKITGAGTLSVSSGTLTLSNGNNDYSGATTVSGGSLVLGNAAALGSSAVTLSGGGQLAAAGAATVTAGITLGAGGGNLKGGSGDYAKFTGRITGGTAGQTALTINQGYVWLDSSANDFQGNVSITSYYLKTSRSEVLPDGAVIAIGANGGLKIQGAAGNYVETIGGLSSSSNYGVWAESPGVNVTLRIGSGNASSSYGGGTENLTQVGGATLALVKIGTGALTLTSNAGYSAGTTVSAGTLIANASGALGSGAVTVGDADSGSANASLLVGNVTVANAITVANQGTGTFTLGANGSVANPEFSGAITLNRDVVLNGSTNTDRMTFSGGIGGTGGIIVRGTQRVLFLTAANTFGGGVTIDSGATLQLDYGTSTATSYIPDSALVTVNGTLLFAKGSNSETIGGLAGSGSVLGHPGVGSTASALVLAGSGSSSFAGTLSDGGATGSTLALAKSGSGTQELTNAANSYTGGTSVTGGILSFANGALGASGTVSLGGGTLRWASGNTQDISGRLGLVNGQTATLDTNGNDVTLGTAFGAGSTAALSKSGSGTLTLGAANGYTGGTTIAAGTVALGAAGALGSGGVTIANGGALSLGGQSLGSASLTLSGSGSGTGALVNDGVATTLSGTVTLAADATLGGSGDITLGGTVGESTAGRTLTKAGSGTLNLDGTATLGALDISSGLLVLNGSLTGALTIDSGATLGGSGTINGAVTISGAHNPGNSPGIQTINGSVTYNAGATFGWELTEDVDVQPFPLVAFDQIVINSGNLNFAGTTTLNLAFNAAGSTVDWSSIFWDTPRSWVIFDVTSGSISNASNLVLGSISIDGFGASLSALEDGTFSVYHDGNTIVLAFAPVPEPSTYGLALGALGLAAAAIRRRRKVSK